MKQRLKNSLFLKCDMFKRNIRKKNRDKNFVYKFEKKNCIIICNVTLL